MGEWLQSVIGLETETQSRVITSLAIIAMIMILRGLVAWIIARRTEDVRFRYHARKVSAYVSASLALLLLGRIWFYRFSGYRHLPGSGFRGFSHRLKGFGGQCGRLDIPALAPPI